MDYHMEKTLREIEKLVPMKDETAAGDVVIVVMDNPLMVAYALVLDIVRDTSKRDEWWHIDFLFLTVPPQPVTWTLRSEQFTGREIFTMGGDKRFVKAVDLERTVGMGMRLPGEEDDGGDGGPQLRLVD